MNTRSVTVGFALLVASWPAVSFAEGFDANSFQPTPLATDGFTVARPTALEHQSFGFVGTLSYAHNPLIERVQAQDGSESRRALIGDQVYGLFGLAYGLWDGLTFHATLPVAFLQSGADASPGFTTTTPTPSSTAIGDLRFGVRARIFGGLEGEDPSRFGVGLDVSSYIPTGSQDAFASDGKGRLSATLITEALPADYLYVGANAGVMARAKSEMSGADVGSTLHLAGSAGYRTSRDTIRVGVEASTRTRLASTAFEGASTGVETLGVAAMRFLDGRLVASVGAGPGFSSAPGSPDFRALARIGWAPMASRAYEVTPMPVYPPAPEPGPVSAPEPPSDRDGDGIADNEDACPDVAGVASDDPELHGCPPVKVTEEAIEIAEQIHFEFGLATLRSGSDTTLKSIAKALRDHPAIEKLSIEGHTDERGSDALNLSLSQARAEAVRAFLIAQGIEASRLTTEGHGKKRPIADNATEEGREKNRRVEFRITKRAKGE